MTFREFKLRYEGWWGYDPLEDDAAWRAYDFPSSVKPRHVQKALKALGLTYAGELAVPQFMALYGFEDRAEAETMVGAWWLWSQIDQGRRVAGLKRREVGE